MAVDFKIDTKLESDSFFIADLELSQLRLINNSDYPWLILITRVDNIVEITDLSHDEYQSLCCEIRLISHVVQSLYKPDKINIATIGNIVKQLHVHIIARFKNDKLFPKTVWGCEFTPYAPLDSEKKILEINKAIKNHKA